MKQKTKEILRTMVKKRADQLNERTGKPPQHIQDNIAEGETLQFKQETFWK
jgi:hypothetical protein